MLYLKVPRKDAEKTRRELQSRGLLSSDYDIFREGDLVYIPVTAPFGDFESVELDTEKRDSPPGRLRDALLGLLTESELDSFVGSFDIIGDIAVVEIPDELAPRESDIGKALLQVHRSVRTVLKKLGGMEGEYRVRRFACIAGEDRTGTTYRENGLSMRLDLSKVYFSPRLSTERKRIAGLARKDEDVLVLFAGVGPFALAVAKERPDSRITAVELNPDAVLYMRENVLANKLKNIKIVEGDARDLKYRDEFDRIVMPLPKSAHEFLGQAFASVREGGTVHFYTIVGSKDPISEAYRKAKAAADDSGVVIEVVSSRIVRPYSPSMVQVVLDLKIRKPIV